MAQVGRDEGRLEGKTPKKKRKERLGGQDETSKEPFGWRSALVPGPVPLCFLLHGIWTCDLSR